MKRILLCTALSLALAGPAALAAQQPAQQPTTPQEAPPANAPIHHHHHHRHHLNPQRQAAMLSRRLNLSTDQTAKLEPILATRDQQFHALMQNSSLTPEQRHQQFRAIHQSTEQQLASVLTPEQLQQMKAMRHNHRRFNPNGPNQPNQQSQPPAPPSGL